MCSWPELSFAQENTPEGILEKWQVEHPGKKAIRLDRGVSGQPLRGAPLAAMQAAVAQLGCKGTFWESGPAGGHVFLRQAAAEAYATRAALTEEELFVLPGAREALMLLMGLLEPGAVVLAAQPGAPMIENAAWIAGHKLLPLRAAEENGFLPMPNQTTPRANIICLCTPAITAGEAYTAQALEQWVEYAANVGALLILDTTYAAFGREGTPRSALHSPQARRCVAEVCSLAPVEGFSGVRCAVLTVPRDLHAAKAPLYSKLVQRLDTGFGGLAYPVQRAAEAFFASGGWDTEPVCSWRANALAFTNMLQRLNLRYWGGLDAPFIWLRAPKPYANDSLGFFSALLHATGIVCTPGILFGEGGEGWIRLSALGDTGATEIAVKRLEQLIQSLTGE